MAVDSRASGAIGGAAQGAGLAARLMPGNPWAPVIGGVVGGIGGLLSGGGEDEVEALARLQAKLIRQTADENIRRMGLERDQVVGLADASIFASNVLMSGSSKRYRNTLESQFRSNIAWEREKSRVEQRIALKGGAAAASQIQSSGIQSMVRGLSTLADSELFQKTKKVEASVL